MSNRYVILHHELAGGEHWDFMLERGDVLATWRLSREPRACEDLPTPARRIGDHRKAYLTYEGPVSGHRGHVTRVDAGTVIFENVTSNRWVFRLLGGRFSGLFVLAEQGDQWVWDVLSLQSPNRSQKQP